MEEDSEDGFITVLLIIIIILLILLVFVVIFCFMRKSRKTEIGTQTEVLEENDGKGVKGEGCPNEYIVTEGQDLLAIDSKRDGSGEKVDTERGPNA